MGSISISDYTKQETLYKEGSVEIFKAVIKTTGQEIVIKKVKILSSEELNEIHREGLMMATLEHPNFVKFYGISQEESGSNRFVLLFMEYFPRGDLSKEIKRRITDNEYWAEEDLWDCFKSLTQAYSFLQRQRIAHRNIKPENIFVGNDGTLKVSGFQCALQIEEQETKTASKYTIEGTPLYFSPKLREAYMNFNWGLSDNYCVKHDPFKSDVYSLGLIFLYMASLKELVDLTDLNTFNYKKAQRENDLRYSQRVKSLLRCMLRYNEAKRPNFIKLEEVFTNNADGNIQVQPKLNTVKIKATQISDYRMLQDFHSIKVLFKTSYINPYISYILQVIKNDVNSYYVWALITFAKSVNFDIKIGTLTYKCLICSTGDINFLFSCNCGAKYFIHQECWNQKFICPYCC